MQAKTVKKKVLITVKTYPVPSQKYQETVCTAGITEEGEWIRLYPIEYRYLPPEIQYKKYQWIEIELQPRNKNNDKRKESYKPILDSIKLLSDPIPTDNGWLERRKIIDKLPHLTLNQYKELYDKEGVSLGIVRPTEIINMSIEKIEGEWDDKQLAILGQQRLFDEDPKELAKIPYKFSYVFRCEDSTTPHKAMCEDWELGVLFVKERKRLKSDEAAAKSVRHKFFTEICHRNKDTRFFMGTVYPYNTWIVLGLFYPPKIKAPSATQLGLFDG